jgi:lipid II isoglutaminyl synthase (glutamine-hydrolysing)
MPHFYITHLYPNEMSIYGDMGNILALQHRLKELNINPVYQTVGINQALPVKTDLYFMGGGQDKEQFLIYSDLLSKKERIVQDIENDVCLLSICGGYQAFGEEFLSNENKLIPGLGIFPVKTKAKVTKQVSTNESINTYRCIGNLIVECTLPDLKGVKLVGFENHGGQTYFTQTKQAQPLGKVLLGYGNNWDEKIEGCVYKNAIGTYLHGSCLPKNPELTDWLISKALIRKQLSYDSLPYSNIAMRTKNTLIERFI